jgi:serine/threonine protein kinase
MIEQTPIMAEADRQRALELSTQQAHPPAPVPGYDKMRFLGRGAFGEVWLAVDSNTGRQVAVKFYNHRDSPDWSQLSREVEKLRFLFSDRHVVQLLAVGWDAEPAYYVMEYLEQGSLEELIKSQGHLNTSEAVSLFRDIAIGLIHAHRKGIFHCDLKPANVLLDQDRRPRLADFGQARLPHEKVPALGTLFYMAPEQADLKATPDPRWDVYALGAVLYCMLTGLPPHQSDKTATVLARSGTLAMRLEQYRRVIRESPLPSGHRKVTDRALADIVDRCLAPDPEQRFPTVQAVLDALDARALRRARRAMLVLGGLGPALLLLVMTAIGWKALDTSVHESKSAVLNRALEGDRFAARFVAEQFALDIDKRWRILEHAATNPALHHSIERLNELPEGDDGRRPVQTALQKWIEDEHGRSNLQFRPGTQPRVWFLLDRAGTLVAFSPYNDLQINKNFAERDFFHGLGYDLPSASRETQKMQPLRQPRRSHVFRSRVTSNLMTALSVPIRSATHGQEPIGVLCMAVEAGAFADFLGNPKQFAVLIDTRPDAVNKKRGLIVEHPGFDSQPEIARQEYYVAPDVLERVERLQKKRVEDWRREISGASPPSAAPQGSEDFSGDYVDPIAGPSEDNRWLAAVEPVVVVRGRKELIDTAWAVVVQERYDQAQAPVNVLHGDLIRLGLGGLAAVAVVVVFLWGFVILVLNDSTRERLTRFLRRRAGLASERSVASSTPPPAGKSDATAEWYKKTDVLEQKSQ